MTPTVGRIVHFGPKDKPKAAIITRVWEGHTVNLFVFGDGTTTTFNDFRTSVRLGDGPFEWHWPEIVDRPRRSEEIRLGSDQHGPDTQRLCEQVREETGLPPWQDKD